MTSWRLAWIGKLCLLAPLAGCVSMSGVGGDSKYSCAAPEGVVCESVSGTYANAVQRELPGRRQATRPSPPPASDGAQPGGAPPRQPLAPTVAPLARTGAPATANREQRAPALRSQARVLRLWTKPWEDIDGDLYDQGYVYVQIDGGRWQIDHVQQAIRDRYAPLRPPPVSSTGGGAADAIRGTDAASTPPARRPSAAEFPMLTTPAAAGARTP